MDNPVCPGTYVGHILLGFSPQRKEFINKRKILKEKVRNHVFGQKQKKMKYK